LPFSRICFYVENGKLPSIFSLLFYEKLLYQIYSGSIKNFDWLSKNYHLYRLSNNLTPNLGSGSWAFYDVYREFDKIVAVEPAVPMRKLGKFLTEDLQKIMWFDSLARLVNVHDMDGLFDIVYCGYVIEEAKSPEGKNSFLSIFIKFLPKLVL